MTDKDRAELKNILRDRKVTILIPSGCDGEMYCNHHMGKLLDDLLAWKKGKKK